MGKGVPARAVVLSLTLLGARSASADPLGEMVSRADHILRSASSATVLRMQVHTAAFDRTYEMVSWEDDRGSAQQMLVKILGPALWRGFGTLKVGSRMSLYDPGADRVTVLASSMLGQSWMGSHFTNDDLVKQTDLARDFTIRELRTWKDGANTYHELELTPRPTAPVAWHHIVLQLYTDGRNVIPVKQDFYRRAGEGAARTLVFADVGAIGGRTAPRVLTMTVADKPGEFTRLTYEKARFDAPVAADKFTEQALRQ
jgi:hypothetical protein